MQRANLKEQASNDAVIGAVARIMYAPLDLGQPPRLASYQMYFAVLVRWLARSGLWWGALKQHIAVSRGQPTSTNDAFAVDQSAIVTADSRSPHGEPAQSK